jgi:hypothetical protein
VRPAQPLRAAVAAIAALAIAAAPAAAEAPAAAPAQAALTIRIGQAEDFSRVEFRWAAGAQMGVRRAGQVLTISFSRDAKPDLGILKTVPLKWIKSVDVRHEKGGVVFALTLSDDADAVRRRRRGGLRERVRQAERRRRSVPGAAGVAA